MCHCQYGMLDWSRAASGSRRPLGWANGPPRQCGSQAAAASSARYAARYGAASAGGGAKAKSCCAALVARCRSWISSEIFPPETAAPLPPPAPPATTHYEYKLLQHVLGSVVGNTEYGVLINDVNVPSSILWRSQVRTSSSNACCASPTHLDRPARLPTGPNQFPHSLAVPHERELPTQPSCHRHRWSPRPRTEPAPCPRDVPARANHAPEPPPRLGPASYHERPEKPRGRNART